MWIEIKQNLIELPRKIMEKEEELYELQTKLNERELMKKLIEDQVMDDITKVTAEDGKPVYSNAEKRRIELIRRLKKAEDYQRATEDIKEKSDKIARERRILDFMKRTNTNSNSLVMGFVR